MGPLSQRWVSLNLAGIAQTITRIVAVGVRSVVIGGRPTSFNRAHVAAFSAVLAARNCSGIFIRAGRIGAGAKDVAAADPKLSIVSGCSIFSTRVTSNDRAACMAGTEGDEQQRTDRRRDGTTTHRNWQLTFRKIIGDPFLTIVMNRSYSGGSAFDCASNSASSFASCASAAASSLRIH